MDSHGDIIDTKLFTERPYVEDKVVTTILSWLAITPRPASRTWNKLGEYLALCEITIPAWLKDIVVKYSANHIRFSDLAKVIFLLQDIEISISVGSNGVHPAILDLEIQTEIDSAIKQFMNTPQLNLSVPKPLAKVVEEGFKPGELNTFALPSTVTVGEPTPLNLFSDKYKKGDA